MTDEQRKMVDELAGCTFIPGSYHKRFVRDMITRLDKDLTEKQAAFLVKLRVKYRRQITNTCNASQR